MRERPDSPGRMVRMSAAGPTCEALIPKARRSCEVATYTGPDQERPAAACCSEALVELSAMMSREPRPAAMPRAAAAIGRSLLPVTPPPYSGPGLPLGV